jgi:hypothetical protein
MRCNGRPTSSRVPWWFLAVIVALGCGAARQAEPEPKLSPPATVCDIPALDDKAFCLPERADKLLRTGRFEILQQRKPKSGMGGASILYLRYPDDHLVIKAKWKTSAKGGHAFNNDPRREIAAYKAQSLILGPKEFVVPPTVGRCIPTATFLEKVRPAAETFEGAACVFGVLSYWLTNVSAEGVFDAARFNVDPAYRQSVANMNLLTYLIDHRDTRRSNFLISTDPAHPRTFAVDNGLAFSGFRNPLAFFTKKNWAHIIVPGLPRERLERLRKLTRHDLDTLLTVAQYSVTPEGLVEVPPTSAFSDSSGVRREGDVIQLGLTRREVDGVAARLNALLEKVDRGKIKVF